jgi:transposase
METVETAAVGRSAGVAAGVRAARENSVAVAAARQRRTPAPRGRARLELVTGVALGPSLIDVARGRGRTERTVTRWLGAFAPGGGAALADAPRGGRPPKAAAGSREALERAAATPPRALGRLVDPWTSDRLSA